MEVSKGHTLLKSSGRSIAVSTSGLDLKRIERRVSVAMVSSVVNGSSKVNEKRRQKDWK